MLSSHSAAERVGRWGGGTEVVKGKKQQRRKSKIVMKGELR